jgi:peptide/nickel transport system permease protein
LRHLILPAATLCVIPTGIITRTVRALVAETMNQEFVVALRARGLGGGALFRHVARNAAPTVLAVTGLQVGYLMGGSILVETVFAWPGIGRLAFDALLARDYQILLGVFLATSVLVLVFNLITDLLYAWIDPRVEVM